MKNAERNAEMIRLIKTGMSYGQVAKQFNVSRNVVCGVCNRAKYAGDRATTSRVTNVRKTKIAVEKAPRYVPPPKPVIRVAPDDPTSLIAAALISKATNAERARLSYLRSLSATTRVL